MFICFVDFDFLIECATNLKCKQQHGRGRIINMPAGGGGRGVCGTGTGTGLGLSKQTHFTPLHTLNAQDEANYEHACEQWTVNKGNLYENTKVSHLSLAVSAGELTVPMTGQNKQKEDADTDADTDQGHEHTDTDADRDRDKARHRSVRLCYCYLCRCWCWISNWLPGVTWGTMHCDEFLSRLIAWALNII